MTLQKEYDVIILGAGPAGLSVASELSKELSVLVFDKKHEIQETTKSWLIPDMAITIGDAQDILPFMKNGVKRFLANTFQGVDVQWQAHLKYHFAREHELLSYWGEQAKEKGSDILLSCMYVDSFVTPDAVVVSTSEGDFRSKLLIDASGGHSPVRSKYALTADWYWWSVCGAIVTFPEGLPEGMQVGDYQLWQTFRDTNINPDESLSHGRPVWEYEVLDENSAFVFIFYLGQYRVPFDDMQEEFMHVLRKENATAAFHDSTISEIKHGWYPSGGPHSQQVSGDRVAFIGTAGCWTSPCGWGVSFIVANYKHYAHHLIDAVRQGHLKKKQLNKIINVSPKAKYQVLLDQIATHFLSFAPASQLNDFISLFNPKGPLGEAGPLMCEKLFTMTISNQEALHFLKLVVKRIGIKALAKNIPEQDYLLLLDLLKDEAEVVLLDVLNKKQQHSVNDHHDLIKQSGFSISH